jgi:hypothetical protein
MDEVKRSKLQTPRCVIEVVKQALVPIRSSTPHPPHVFGETMLRARSFLFREFYGVLAAFLAWV